MQGGFRNPIVHTTSLIGEVQSDQIADGAIIEAKLANLAVAAGKLQDQAVQNSKLADDSVSTIKIQDASIVTAKIGLLAVGSAQIANAAITNAKIANLAVDTAKIANAAITNAKINDLAVGSAQISDILQSDNWDGTTVAARDATQGWRIEKDTGDIGANDLVARGDIFSGVDGGDETRIEDGVVTVTDGAASVRIDPSNFSESGVSNPEITLIRSKNAKILHDGDLWIFAPGSGKIGGTHIFLGEDPSGGGDLDLTSRININLLASGNITLDADQVLIPDGIAGAPGIAFNDDIDTGIYRLNNNILGISLGGTLAYRIGNTTFRGGDGSLASPALSFLNDTNTGIYRIGADEMGFVTGATLHFQTGGSPTNPGIVVAGGSASFPGVRFAGDSDTGIQWESTNRFNLVTGGVGAVQVTKGGSDSSMFLRDGLRDVGNVEILRLDRGSGTAGPPIGYSSSWEFDPITGDRAKADIVSLVDSPRFPGVEVIDQLRAIDFERISTGEREWGFLLDDFREVGDDLRYLTSKGDKWGHAIDEPAILSVLVEGVKDLRERVAALDEGQTGDEIEDLRAIVAATVSRLKDVEDIVYA